MLVGAERVAFGLEESVPFCELAALAAKEGAALAKIMLPAAVAAMRMLLRISGLPPPEAKRCASACRPAVINPAVMDEFPCVPAPDCETPLWI